ncbi:hypothetical protein D6855_04445 [Butyrivibrio sp. CB08]|uniref:hypothetical protein n=1 Tax=Butyrivibrio sp. CB08 TaxID=2364879 RepID=UPI000EA8AB12|nr:hypothetical protein [Butyrivibrio sp. CB08]RKM61154.1 hypothetical protein D6855_04445 [Butyrivibrio sp. CB08]
MNNLNKSKKTKPLRTILIVITVVVTIGAVFFCYSSEIFQKGNPLPYLHAASAITEEYPYVKVNVEAEGPVYISRRGECQELLQYISDSSGLEFQEQAGSVYLFSDGMKTISLESENYWSVYTLWTVLSR